MNEKHFTLLTVRIPPDLQGVLEELSVEKGEVRFDGRARNDSQGRRRRPAQRS